MVRKLWERWKVVARKIGMCNRDFGPGSSSACIEWIPRCDSFSGIILLVAADL